jgi:stage III sporulation protein AE
MKKILCVGILALALAFPVSASGIVAPPVPDDVQQLMPPEDNSFGDRLWYLIKEAAANAQPAVASALKICFNVVASILMIAVLQNFHGKSKRFVELAGVVAVSCILIGSTNSMIHLGTDTVSQISQYGKLLLPGMSAALASQGGSISAASIYGATVLFDTVLCSLISSILLPMLNIYLVLAIVSAALEDDFLKKMRDLLKKVMTWCLKILLYVFTGYISVTGVISGTADQTAIKAAKLTISGMVPVVGGILSDASETVLISAGLVKNATGIYGFLAIVAVAIVPFLTIGINYLLLQVTSAICTVFSSKSISNLLSDFAGAMGLVLGMTGAVCLIQLISVVCFLKGMS